MRVRSICIAVRSGLGSGICLRRMAQAPARGQLRLEAPTDTQPAATSAGLLVFNREEVHVRDEEAYARPTPRAEKAPKDGIGKIDLIATAPVISSCRSPKSSACDKDPRRRTADRHQGTNRGSPPTRSALQGQHPIKKGQSLAPRPPRSAS